VVQLSIIKRKNDFLVMLKNQVSKDKYKQYISLESSYFVVFENHFEFPLLINNLW